MITLTTILYEGNMEQILSEDSLFFKLRSNLITNKLIIINNVTSKDKLQKLLINMWEVQPHPFEVQYVEHSVNNAIRYFKLNINENTLGYHYTIPYFVMLLHVKTPHMLNIASDCMNDIQISDEYLTSAINELNLNPNCSTTMIAWTKNNYVMANGVTIGQHENIETFKLLNKDYIDSTNFNYTFNFTDQFFLGSVEKLLNIDYNIDEKISERIYNGPAYGGNSFEKRIVGHQVLNNLYNCIYKGPDYYIHDGKYY
jgi:hypothetical protein